MSKQPEEAKVCTHGKQHWRTCGDCHDEVEMALVIARTYLRELANENGWTEESVCKKPVSEAIQGRTFQQVASLALSAMS